MTKAAKQKRVIWIVTGVIAGLIIIGTIASAGSKSKATTSTTSPTSAAHSAPTTAAAPTTAPPATSPPTTQSQAQIVQGYQNSTTSVTASQLANDPSTYKGQGVTFTGTIDTFLQDSSGNTTAMNVADPNDPTSVIYVQLSNTADVTQMNKGDTVVIWGDALGSVSGKNAYGGTINQSAVNEVYLTDQTTNYSDTSNSSPS